MLQIDRNADLGQWTASGFFNLIECWQNDDLESYFDGSHFLEGSRLTHREVTRQCDYSGVYVLYFRRCGKFYIGSSRTMSVRTSIHFSRLKRTDHPNRRMLGIYRQYNQLPEIFFIITNGEDHSRIVEQRLIDLVFDDPYCLNQRQLVEEYRPATDETKGRLRDAAKRQWEREGFRETIRELNRRPDEVKRRSDIGKRLGQDPERNKHFSETTRRQWEREEYREAQKKSGSAVWEDPEFRDRHSAAMKAKWADPDYRASIKRKPINYITITIGDVTYPHAKAAAAALGISVNTARRRAAKEVLDE